MRRLQALVALVGLVAMGTLGLQTASGAAAGYPGATTNGGSSSQALSTVDVGGSFGGTVCGYQPGSIVTFDVDGTADATATANSGGCATFTGHATDPHLSVLGGAPITVSYGSNQIGATGTSSTGGMQTDTVVVPLAASDTSATTSSAGLALTGADIMAMVIFGMALMALGFLILTFSRRRVPTTYESR
ncbi:MAG TPA: hypothetical protein VGL48_18190 [Acidimicrobiales bacterium]